MNLIPYIDYQGDKEKAITFKGMALQFYQFVIMGMGNALTINRTKQLSDGVYVNAWIYTNAQGCKCGKLTVYVDPSGVEEIPAKLFCTSFNAGVDDGTQVYKKPYPPITQGGLYSPNVQTTEYPDYSARTNYRNSGSDSSGTRTVWVDKKEENCISWSYEEFYYLGSYRKSAKLSIQGLENPIDDSALWYKDPICCCLIPFDEDNPTIQRLVMVYRDRVNYLGTGTTRYCRVYDYELDFTNQKIDITLVSTFNLTTAGYGSKTLYGFMDDAKTMIFKDARNISYYEGDFLYNNKTLTSTLNYFVFNADYTSIDSTNEIYVDLSIFNIYKIMDGILGIIGETTVSEDFQQSSVDVRHKVRFCTEKKVATNQYEYYRASWSLSSGLSKSLFDTSSGAGNGVYGMIHTDDDLIYSRYTSSSASIHSKKAGLLLNAFNASHYYEEYSWIKGSALVVSFYYDSADYSTRYWKSVVLDYKKSKKEILDDTDLKTISVTKLSK